MQSFIDFSDRMHRTCNLEKICLFNGYCYGLTELKFACKSWLPSCAFFWIITATRKINISLLQHMKDEWIMLLYLVMVFSFLQTCLCKMQSCFTKSLSFCKHSPDKRTVWTKATQAILTRSLWRHNRKYGRLCNFVVYQGRRANFGRLGYFDVYFSKNYLFIKLNAYMTSLWRHNWCILERPCNFAIFDGRSPKFCMLYCFDVFP